MSDTVCVKLSVRGPVDAGLGMYVVGCSPQLGQWKARQAIALQQLDAVDKRDPEEEEEEEDNDDNDDDYKGDAKSTWECTVLLPKNSSISFRYFIGKVVVPNPSAELEQTHDIEVILWETNVQPRQLKTQDADEMQLPVAEFGTYDGIHTTSHGWLENHACVQVRFHSNPIFMWKPKHRQQVYSIKCSPVDYESGMTDILRTDDSVSLELFTEDSSLDGPPPCKKTSMDYYNLNQGQPRSKHQPQTGCIYNQDDYLVFMARGINQLHLGFQVDFYVHAKRAQPQYVGSAHLLPPKPELSVYSKRVPIIGLNHRPIGEVQVEILRITPLPNNDYLMDVSYQNHWKWRNVETLNVGHRGMGSSYKRVTSAKENTIRSLYSAARHGADFVELDVLLSRDSVPVIYHDFSVCLSTPLKAQIEGSKRMVEVAIKDLSLEQLQSMKIYHHSSNYELDDTHTIEITEDASGSDDHDQPFPTLRCCLEQVDPQVGFNIEIKYPQHFETGENEQDNFFDINHFVDRILEVVMKHAGNRKVIFSTFHADTCIMVSLKQNKYPVLFLSNGPTQRYTPYKDWRCSNFQHGINFAKAEGLLGVNFQAEGLLQDLTLIPYIKSLGLVLFVWGEDLNEEHVKRTLRKHQVDAIIFDRIGQNHPDQFLLNMASSSMELVIRRASEVPSPNGDTASESGSNGSTSKRTGPEGSSTSV